MKRRLNSFTKGGNRSRLSILPLQQDTAGLKQFIVSSSIGLRNGPSKFKETVMNIELLYSWEASV